MTPDAILRLSVDDLPTALRGAGLAPDNVKRGFWHRLEHFLTHVQSWRPHTSWQDAMPLLERLHARGWRSTLRAAPALHDAQFPDTRQYQVMVCKDHVQWGSYYLPADGPATICRVALLAHYGEETR